MRVVLEAMIALLWKDMLVTLRTPWELLALIVFSVLSAIPVALLPATLAGKGVIVTILFMTVYVSTQSYVREARMGTLELHYLYPISPSVHYIEKTVYTMILLTIAIVAHMATLSLLGLYNRVLEVTPMTLASTIYLASIASLSSLIATHLRGEMSLLIAMTSILAIPPLISINSNPPLIALSGLAYTIIALIIAELLESW